MITFLAGLLVGNPAQAGDVLPPTASLLRQGQWSTAASLCSGVCVGLMNLSYTNCVSFGFVGATADRQHGNIAVVDGDGNGLGVYIADGPDANSVIDGMSCVPPRETVWGSVDGLGQVDQYGVRWIAMTTTKYPVGRPSDHATSFLRGVKEEIWGAYFAPSGEPIPTAGTTGNRENFRLRPWAIMPIGG